MQIDCFDQDSAYTFGSYTFLPLNIFTQWLDYILIYYLKYILFLYKRVPVEEQKFKPRRTNTTTVKVTQDTFSIKFHIGK